MDAKEQKTGWICQFPQPGFRSHWYTLVSRRSIKTFPDSFHFCLMCKNCGKVLIKAITYIPSEKGRVQMKCEYIEPSGQEMEIYKDENAKVPSSNFITDV